MSDKIEQEGAKPERCRVWTEKKCILPLRHEGRHVFGESAPLPPTPEAEHKPAGLPERPKYTLVCALCAGKGNKEYVGFGKKPVTQTCHLCKGNGWLYLATDDLIAKLDSLEAALAEARKERDKDNAAHAKWVAQQAVKLYEAGVHIAVGKITNLRAKRAEEELAKLKEAPADHPVGQQEDFEK